MHIALAAPETQENRSINVVVRRQNPGACLGTTKEKNLPSWHLLDPRFERLEVAQSGLRCLKMA